MNLYPYNAPFATPPTIDGGFKPPKHKPQGRQKYLIDGEVYYLISKADLERDMKTTAQTSLQDKKKRIMSRAKLEVDKMIEEQSAVANKLVEEEWNKREDLFRNGDDHENFMNMLQFLLSISCRILIEKFHWKPIPKDGIYDRRNHTMRFADYMVDEIARICGDDEMDIMKYSKETFEKYGVMFKFGEEDGEES